VPRLDDQPFQPGRGAEGYPKGVNVALGSEDALNREFGLRARVMEINRLNRSTREGKAAAVNLWVYTDGGMTVTEGKTK
jgi:hypothetical protein